MQKPISISIDTKNDDSVVVYNNIRKGDTLLMNIKVFQDSASLNLTGQTMHIVLQKPDGYTVEKIINSVTGNNFDVAFDVQATLAVGDVEGIVEISDSNGTNITNIFSFEVKPNPSYNIVIKSSDQIETLSQIVALINEYSNNSEYLAEQNNLSIQNKIDMTALNSTSNDLITTLETDINSGQSLHETLQDDFVTGNALDTSLKEDIVNGSNVHNNLSIAILNGNDVLYHLGIANWTTIQQMIDLFNVVVQGIQIIEENANNFTDENGNIFVM